MLQGLTVTAAVLRFGVTSVLTGATSLGEVSSAVVNAAKAATGEATGATPQLTPAETDAIQDATALTAWWAFGVMMLGAVGAIAGGKLGSDHPDWHERERASRTATMADKV